MRTFLTPFVAASAFLAPVPVLAEASVGFEAEPRAELPPYLQCVPYARQLSGIQIYGDAHTWWEQAEGRYDRGKAPRAGAVMAFAPTGRMQLGHVAAVSKVIDSRTVLLDHANWSPIDGRRGQIERNVRAVDVSPGNDWSMVRVWYHPLQDLGTTEWPVHGFIYSGKAGLSQPQLVRAEPARQPAPRTQAKSRPGQFENAFADLGRSAAAPRPPVARRTENTPAAARPAPARMTRVAAPGPAPANALRARPRDAIDAALSRYD